MSGENIEGPRDLWLRADTEWLRWEGADSDAWVPARRRAWAEQLFADQKRRTCAAYLAEPKLLMWPCQVFAFDRAPQRGPAALRSRTWCNNFPVGVV